MTGAPIAYLTDKRQLHVLGIDGVDRAQTLGVDDLMWGSWTPQTSTRVVHSWPTFLPGGQQLVCFRIEGDAGTAVLVLDVDGVRCTRVAELVGQLPIYLHPSPSGRHVAVLAQSTEEPTRLSLVVAATDQVDRPRPLAHGTPLFFSWLPDDRLVAYVGAGAEEPGRLLVFDLDSGETTTLPGPPGSFCTPVVLERDGAPCVMYVQQRGDVGRVVLGRPDASEPETVEVLEGLVALVASPDGRTVARAVAPGGDGTPYQDLHLIDVQTLQSRPHGADERFLACLWADDEGTLVLPRVETQRNLLAWRVLDAEGSLRPLAASYPTRDQGFFLRFFEQYVRSHPAVSPDGRHLLVAGGLDGHGDPFKDQGIWRVPLDGEAPTRLADGLFAVWGPASSVGS